MKNSCEPYFLSKILFSSCLTMACFRSLQYTRASAEFLSILLIYKLNNLNMNHFNVEIDITQTLN